jgi:hypothetical protein
MREVTQDQSLDHEAEIHWMEDPSQFDYLRERWATAGTRARPVPWEGKSQGAGRMVGYAILDREAPSYSPGKFWRRVWVVCEHDRDEPGAGPYDAGTAPAEGVDPRTIEPGSPGKQNRRAWGSPLP